MALILSCLIGLNIQLSAWWTVFFLIWGEGDLSWTLQVLIISIIYVTIVLIIWKFKYVRSGSVCVTAYLPFLFIYLLTLGVCLLDGIYDQGQCALLFTFYWIFWRISCTLSVTFDCSLCSHYEYALNFNLRFYLHSSCLSPVVLCTPGNWVSTGCALCFVLVICIVFAHFLQPKPE